MLSSLSAITIFMRICNGLTLVKCLNVPPNSRWKQRTHCGVLPPSVFFFSGRLWEAATHRLLSPCERLHINTCHRSKFLYFFFKYSSDIKWESLISSSSSPPPSKHIIIWQKVRLIFFSLFFIQYVDFWICDITTGWAQHNQDTDKADLSRYRAQWLSVCQLRWHAQLQWSFTKNNYSVQKYLLLILLYLFICTNYP